MLDLSYYMPTNIIYGKDCVKNQKQYFQSLGKRCLIVTGACSAKRSGALRDLTQALEDCHISYEIYDQVSQNPLLSSCVEAGKMVRDTDAEFIVGIGGGSPLDAAKAAAVFATNGQIEPIQIFSEKDRNPPLPFVLIGTTAGTGSEVTPYSVLTVDTEQEAIFRKQTVRNLFAAACFCDYRYTLSLNYSITISTALDALSHCIEAYFSKKANTISDVFAKAGIQLIVDVFRDLSPDMSFTEKQRQKLYAASIYGGLAITKTGTCFCHTMGYFLTEEYQIAHGVACAVFLPAFLRLGCETDSKKGDILLFELEDNLSNLCDMIENLTDFKPFHLTQTQKNDLRDRWSRSNKFTTSPGDFSIADAMDLIDDIFE